MTLPPLTLIPLRHAPPPHRRARTAFSLIEVILAISIIAIAVVALLGMFGPTIQSVNKVVLSQNAVSLTNKLHHFLQNDQGFTAVHTRLGSATPHYYAWTEVDDSSGGLMRVDKIAQTYTAPTGSFVLDGPVFRIELSQIPDDMKVQLFGSVANGSLASINTNEGYLPFVVRILSIGAPYNATASGVEVMTYTSAVTR